VAVLVQTSLSSSERIVWTITGLSAVVSFTAVWWFHRIACRTMLVDSLLTQGIVVSFQPSKVLPGTIVGGIFLYGGLVVLDSLVNMSSLTEFAKLLAFILGSLAGPSWSLISAIRAEEEAEQRSTEVRMHGKEFAALSKTSTTTVLPWERALDLGRAGEDLRTHGEAEATDGEMSSEVNTVNSFNLFRDIDWLRRVVGSCTGSPSAYLLLPSFCLALAVLSINASFGAANYLCSRGYLTSLQPATVDNTLDFQAWKDRYVLPMDTSFHEVVLIATVSATTKSVNFTLPRKSNSQQSDHLGPMAINVDLYQVPVPRVAVATTWGWRPSQAPRQYAIRFAPFRRLPVRVEVFDASGQFHRCLSWATLPGSRLSVPPHVSTFHVNIFLTDFVLGVPSQANQPAAGTNVWTEYRAVINSSEAHCRTLCEAEANCLSAFQGHGGCYFAVHHHRSQEQACGESYASQLAVDANEMHFSHLYGCANDEARRCGSGVPISTRKNSESFVSFNQVQPDWQGNGAGALEFSLSLSPDGLQEAASDFEMLALRQGSPLPSDVLVRLEGRTPTRNETPRADASVADDGRITVTIGRYDPLEFLDGQSMLLTIAPVLPDRNFEVDWLLEGQNITGRDLQFHRCGESSLLNARLAACNATAQWPVQILSLTLSRFFSKEEISNIAFTVQPIRAAEQELWPISEILHVSVKFSGVDSPAAWAAEKGCTVVESFEETEVYEAFLRSPDAWCKLLDEQCHDRSRHPEFNATFKKFFWDGFGNRATLTPADQVRVFICAYQNGAMADGNHSFKVMEGWTYDNDPKTPTINGLDNTDENGTHLNYVRRSDVNNFIYVVPGIPLKDFLMSVALTLREHGRAKSARSFLLEICQQTNITKASASDMGQWVLSAAQTGSADLTASVLQCLGDFDGLSLQEEKVRQVANAVWTATKEQIQLKRSSDNFSLLRIMKSWHPRLFEFVFTRLVEDGYTAVLPQLVAATGASADLESWSEFTVRVKDSGLLVDVAKMLKHTRHLEKLAVWTPLPLKALPAYSHEFFQALSKLKRLSKFHFWLVLTPETSLPFAKALSQLPVHELVFEQLSGFKDCFAPGAVRRLGLLQKTNLTKVEFRCMLQPQDATELARAFPGDVGWEWLQLQVDDPSAALAILARAPHLRYFDVRWANKLPTRDEWKHFMAGIRKHPALDTLILMFRHERNCFPPGGEEEFDSLPKHLRRVGLSKCRHSCEEIQNRSNTSSVQFKCNPDFEISPDRFDAY